jgi:hypothetical protein
MLEVRVKQLEKQAREDFRYSESLMAKLTPFLRKEAAEMEAAKKEAAEKEVTEKEVAEKEDNDDEEDQQARPS